MRDQKKECILGEWSWHSSNSNPPQSAKALSVYIFQLHKNEENEAKFLSKSLWLSRINPTLHLGLVGSKQDCKVEAISFSV